MDNNKYNSLSFRIWIDFNNPDEPKKEVEGSESEDDNRIQKQIRLKNNRIREDVFAYLRASMMQKHTQEQKEHLLLTTPVDPKFEMLMAACAVNLFTSLLNTRFKTSLEDDLVLLKDTDMPMRKRFAVMHRRDCKQILMNNITICQILARVLALIQVESEKNP